MNIFQNNIGQYQATLADLAKTLNKLSTLRLAAFVLSVILIVVLANERMVTLVLLAVPLCAFGFSLIIKRYNRLAHLRQHTTFLNYINEGEVLKLESALTGFPDGQEFIELDHPYVADLDIFGPHSLFQLLNRTTTDSGNVLLAKWLTAPASKEEILERQQAMKELSPKLDWRQHFQASGMHFRHTASDHNKLLAWIEKPVQLLPRHTKYLIGGIVLSLLTTGAAAYFLIHIALIGFFESIIPFVFPLIICLIVNSLILRRVRYASEEITENLHHHINMLGGWQSLIINIETEEFHSAKLQQLQSAFRSSNASAAREISRLKNILEVFLHRGAKGEFIGRNFLYTIFNSLWLLDVFLVVLTEKWKHKNAAYLRAWATAASEFEVLSSLAGFSYANPTYTFPEVKEEPYSIRFEEFGHPLIKPSSRVCNSFDLEGRGEIAMITGSNMAGKSTFLRTVGVNLVLALMGAPCCAKAAQVSTMKVFTSMRTQDNLEEGVSSFYAELRKIEHLLKLIERGKPIFFLLDEMFKGTNSEDRHKGGFSLIKQLQELNAFGIISTHDLELGKLAGNHKIVSNYSFNSEIRDGEMFFSYELTDGLCRDFNASELMKRSGIKILSRIEEV